MNQAKDSLNNPEFKERLEMLMKGFIDKSYHDANKQPPVPESLIPLRYSDERVQKGLNQLMQGAKNALYCYDQFVKENNDE